MFVFDQYAARRESEVFQEGSAYAAMFERLGLGADARRDFSLLDEIGIARTVQLLRYPLNGSADELNGDQLDFIASVSLAILQRIAELRAENLEAEFDALFPRLPPRPTTSPARY